MYNLQQHYEEYTADDREVWKLLYDRQTALLQNKASSAFLNGLEKLQFTNRSIPDFRRVNNILSETTGWQIEVVPGLIEDARFFDLLSNKRFPSSTWLRKMNQLDYLEEPDMFHDCFAHMPLLTDSFFVTYLEALAKIALKHINDALAVELIGRIYWFTVEFGLIKEGDDMRIYGAGILSSNSESNFCLSEQANRKAFNIKEIMEKHYYKDHFQDRYYVIESYKDLSDAIPEINQMMEYALARIPHDGSINATPLDLNL